VAVASAGPYSTQVCTSLQTENHASTPSTQFLQAECPSCRPTNPTASKQSTKLKHFSRTFKDPNCIFQAPKLSTIRHILDADIQNLDCNVTLKCTVWGPTVLTNTVMIKASDRLPSSSTGDTHTSACFKIVNKCKISKLARFTFKDFSRIFKHLTCFQALSRALKFLFQIQAFSRISQACYEP